VEYREKNDHVETEKSLTRCITVLSRFLFDGSFMCVTQCCWWQPRTHAPFFMCNATIYKGDEKMISYVSSHFNYNDMLQFQTPPSFIHLATEFASNSWEKAKEQTDEPEHRKKTRFQSVRTMKRWSCCGEHWKLFYLIIQVMKIPVVRIWNFQLSL